MPTVSRTARAAGLILACLTVTACATPQGMQAGPAASVASPVALDAKAQVQLRLANASKEAGNLGSAAKLYRSILDSAPNSVPTLISLGEVQTASGSFDEAAETYRKAVTLQPSSLDARIGLGRVLTQLHQPEKALAEFTHALAQAPGDARCRVGKAVTLDMLGRHAEAQLEYRAVLKANPEDRIAANDLGLSLALSGAYDEAIRILGPIADGPGSQPRHRQNLALAYALKGDPQRAGQLARIDMSEVDVQSNMGFYEMIRRTAAAGNPPSSIR